MDELTKILLDTTKNELPPQLDFFTGGENKKFATRVRGVGPSRVGLLGIQESQLVQRYIKNLTICKQVYQEFYSKIVQYFAAMLKMLPSPMITRIKDELRNHYFFIAFNKKIDNILYLNVFCEFYHKYGCFPQADNLMAIPRPQILHFLNGDEAISPSRLFERFQWSDARGLVSVQALVALAVSLGHHISDDMANGVVSEYLHMSHQALDGQNTTILPQFNELMNLMDELRTLFVEGPETAVKQNKEMLEKPNQIMNDYNYAFDLSEAKRIQMEKDKKFTQVKKQKYDLIMCPCHWEQLVKLRKQQLKKGRTLLKYL